MSSARDAATLLIVAVVGTSCARRRLPSVRRPLRPAPISWNWTWSCSTAWSSRSPTSARKTSQIKEDGHVVDVKTFAHVSALGSLQPDDARSVTLLMDDIGVSITGTSAMQAIAQVMLSPSERGDEIAVVRLSSRSDEAFGDVSTALDRIGGYRGGMVPFSRRDTPETMLKMVTKISRQLEAVEHRRKVIICVGLPVCVRSRGTRARRHQRAVAALGRRADRGGSSERQRVLPGPDRPESAGDVPRRRPGAPHRRRVVHQLERLPSAAYSIWRDAGRYYLLGYWPSRENANCTRSRSAWHARTCTCACAAGAANRLKN